MSRLPHLLIALLGRSIRPMLLALALLSVGTISGDAWCLDCNPTVGTPTVTDDAHPSAPQPGTCHDAEDCDDCADDCAIVIVGKLIVVAEDDPSRLWSRSAQAPPGQIYPPDPPPIRVS
jgi:hypothetical protein